MPFSTYLREPVPQSVHKQLYQQSQEGSPHSDGSTPPSGIRLDNNANRHGGMNLSVLTQPQNDFYQQQGAPHYLDPTPTDLTVKTSPSYPTFSSTPTALYNFHPYPPPSSCESPLSASLKQNSSKDAFFQMPQFLLDGLGSSMTPGGGAGVIAPANTFDLNVNRISINPGNTQALDTKAWQSVTNCDDTVVSSVSTTTSIPSFENYLPSPFGYLHGDSPPAKADSTHQAESIVEDDANQTNCTTTSCSVRTPDFRGMLPSVPQIDSLPIYSQSGFDMLKILSRVSSRANPTISLGPVDLTCSFVVADARHPDTPIIYASRTFCELTGYQENEVIGRNCRFLQAPGGRVSRAEARRFTSPDAVRDMFHSLALNKDVQVSLINYRKDGTPFLNRVSIVPIAEDENSLDVAYYVGFQINLNSQPEIIARRMREGSFYSNRSSGYQKPLTPIEQSIRAMGRSLRSFLLDPNFQTSISLTTSCNATAPSSNLPNASSSPSSSTLKNGGLTIPDSRDDRQWLHMSFLETSPDFALVLSLKGYFLYVSPSVRDVVGHEPMEIVGKSISDFCHPDDSIPLLRELKESGLMSVQIAASRDIGRSKYNLQSHGGHRIVDLLFRMKTKDNNFTWVECLGRMHVEQAKGRKAIILSGRACSMPSLQWKTLRLVPLSDPIIKSEPSTSGNKRKLASGRRQVSQSVDREFWAMLCNDGLFLVTGVAVRDILGWGTGEMIGRSIRDFLLEVNENDRKDLIVTSEKLGAEACMNTSEVLSALERISVAITGPGIDENAKRTLICRMKRRDAKAVWMQVVLFASFGSISKPISPAAAKPSNLRIIAQFKTLASFPLSASHPSTLTTTQSPPISPIPPAFTHPLPISSARNSNTSENNVFAELEPEHQSSWQYELQQLKFANDKLSEEISVLESRQRQQERGTWLKSQT